MSRTRFLILGGYLGAGKTTLAVNLARTLRDAYGISVSIITNDQGDVLVDTEFTKDAGFDVCEVLGGCFCSDFDTFISSARTLVTSGKPDVIIAEPIGTSTNILNSVVSPLRSLYPDEFSVAPLAVVVDCIRAMDILSKDKERTQDSVDLIPANQIKEAEIVILSKADLVSTKDIEKIKAAIKETVPDADIIPTSSVNMMNIDEIVDMIISERMSQRIPEKEDNKRFAFEKAKLGWYSGTFNIVPSERLDMYSLETDILKGVAQEYGIDAVVHVKVIVSSPEASAKMSLVGGSMNVDGIHGSRFVTSPGKLVLNARIVSPPKRLERTMNDLVGTIPSKYGASVEKISESCFSPKPESPSHFFFE